MAEIEWHNLKAAELRELAQRDAIVVVPIGSTEQHGPHLPVQVDATLAGEVSRRAARVIADRTPVVVMPSIWFGLAEHHMAFGGTITLDYETFYGVLRCVCRSIARHGFRRILIVNGHGGNVTALNVAVGELTHELGVPLAVATYWVLAKEAFAEILDRQKGVRHAGEAETSMMLALVPHLVDSSKLSEAKGGTDDPPGILGGTGMYRWQSFKSLSETGVMGDAETATAEKGTKLLAAAAEALADAMSDPELWAAQA